MEMEVKTGSELGFCEAHLLGRDCKTVSLSFFLSLALCMCICALSCRGSGARHRVADNGNTCALPCPALPFPVLPCSSHRSVPFFVRLND